MLTGREREVLALVAEDRSNSAIGGQLFYSRKTVDAHISQIFLKLDLRKTPEHHRRVLAASPSCAPAEPRTRQSALRTQTLSRVDPRLSLTARMLSPRVATQGT